MGAKPTKQPLVSDFEQATVSCVTKAVTDNVTGKAKDTIDDNLATCLQDAINARPKRGGGKGLLGFLRKDKSNHKKTRGRFQFGQQTGSRTRYGIEENEDEENESSQSGTETDDERDEPLPTKSTCKPSGASLGHTKSTVPCLH